jgi:hypothetical protein
VNKNLAWLQRPAMVFLVAAILRFAVVSVFLAQNPLSWGVNEAAGIGRQIVLDHGIATPFHDAVGPTAWLAPIYPSLLACLFFLFGAQTAVAAWATVFLNVIFGSLTSVVVLRLGQEHFGKVAGLLAGWAWAVSPSAVVMPWYLWETCLSALVMTFALLQTLRLGRTSTLRQWIVCGLVWSFAALLNPALLAPLPAILLLKACKERDWKLPATLLLVCALGIAPWTVRNLVALHRLIPVRSNFWPELFFGNVNFSLHPTGPSMLYQHEGEIAFAADLRGRVIDYICSNPGEFMLRTSHRALTFWSEPAYFKPLPAILALASLAGILFARAAGREWISFFCVLLLFPIIYYMSYTFARYRHPIEPVMYSLAAFTVYELSLRGKRLVTAHLRESFSGKPDSGDKAPG